MSPFFYAVLKVGDQTPDLLNKQIGFKDGYLVDVNVPSEWGLPDLLHGRMDKKAFAILKLDSKYLPLFKDLVKSEEPLVSSDMFNPLWRQRTGMFDLSALGTLISSDLESKWRGKDEVVPVDMMGVDISKYVKYAKDLDLSVVAIDRNAIASGTYTIGAGGGFDYLTFITWEADFAATLTGAMTGTLSSDISHAGACVFNTNINGRILTLNSASPHLGNPLAGYTVSIGYNSYGINLTTVTSVGTVNVNNFSIKRATAGVASNRVLLELAGLLGTTYNVNNIFLDGNALVGGGIYCSGRITNMYNVSIRDCDTGVGLYMYLINSAAKTSVCEAILISGCGVGFDGTSTSTGYLTCKNIGVVNCGTRYNAISGVKGYGTLSDDASNADGNWYAGSAGNQINKTPANEYELDDTLATYGRIKSGATLSAYAPTLSAVDMGGDAWSPQYPIGPRNALAIGSVGRLVNAGIVKDGLINGRLIS